MPTLNFFELIDKNKLSYINQILTNNLEHLYKSKCGLMILILN